MLASTGNVVAFNYLCLMNFYFSPLLLLVAVLSGCGQTGALYLPKEVPAIEVEATQEIESNQEE